MINRAATHGYRRGVEGAIVCCMVNMRLLGSVALRSTYRVGDRVENVNAALYYEII